LLSLVNITYYGPLFIELQIKFSKIKKAVKKLMAGKDNDFTMGL
jgi:hypothetical protein